MLKRVFHSAVDTSNEAWKTVVYEVWTLGSRVLGGTSRVLLRVIFGSQDSGSSLPELRAPSSGSTHQEYPSFTSLLESSDDQLTVRKNSAGKTKLKIRSGVSIDDEDLPHTPFTSTGLLEDVRIWLIKWIDWNSNNVRWWIDHLPFVSRFPTISYLKNLPSHLRELLDASKFCNLFYSFSTHLKNGIWGVKDQFPTMSIMDQIDVQKNKEIIVTRSGYPYEKFHVTTEDGYILTLERIPRKDSHAVVYFQHGVMDNSYSWVANGVQGGLAFSIYEQGYDVFLGNFRGACDRGHVKKDISSKEYWDFSLNEHAFIDLPTFINTIKRIKADELKKQGREQKITITAVSHSMGAAATIMYVIYSNYKKVSHGLSSTILLSPAGFHSKHIVADMLGPIIERFLYWNPWFHCFRFPNDIIRIVIGKIVQDIRNQPATRALVASFIYHLLGGSSKENSFFQVPHLTYNIFGGTPVKIFTHFWTMYKKGTFEAFDYGKKRNLKEYGSETPFNFLDNYNLVDIPMYYMAGLHDYLIPPDTAYKHYNLLRQHRLDLAFIQTFENVGHLEFTIGLNDMIVNHIYKILKHTNKQSLRRNTTPDGSLDESSISQPSSVCLSGKTGEEGREENTAAPIGEDHDAATATTAEASIPKVNSTAHVSRVSLQRKKFSNSDSSQTHQQKVGTEGENNQHKHQEGKGAESEEGPDEEVKLPRGLTISLNNVSVLSALAKAEEFTRTQSTEDFAALAAEYE